MKRVRVERRPIQASAWKCVMKCQISAKSHYYECLAYRGWDILSRYKDQSQSSVWYWQLQSLTRWKMSWDASTMLLLLNQAVIYPWWYVIRVMRIKWDIWGSIDVYVDRGGLRSPATKVGSVPNLSWYGVWIVRQWYYLKVKRGLRQWCPNLSCCMIEE